MIGSNPSVLYGDLNITRVTPFDDSLLLGCVAITSSFLIEDITITLTVSCELFCTFDSIDLIQVNKQQTNKQADKQKTSRQTDKRTSKQTNKRIDNSCDLVI